MTVGITIHDCARLRARTDRGENYIWTVFTFVDRHGDKQDITVFFDNETYARRLAQAINTVTEVYPLIEPEGPLNEPIEMPHPDVMPEAK